MRTMLAVASLGLLVGAGFGCGDDTTMPATMDLAVGADMSAVPHDMTLLNCGQIVSCAATATTTADAAACLAEGKQASQAKVNALLTCAAGACGPADGGGTGMCTSVTDTSSGCRTCLGTVIQGGLSGAGACATEGSACASDT